MTVKRTGVGTTLPVAVVRAEPIGLSELRFVRDALAEFAPDWSAELDGICADEATLVVVPESGNDEVGPSFVVSREGYGYRLDQVHWDTIRDVGLFSSVADIVTVLYHRLSMDAVRVHPDTRSIH